MTYLEELIEFRFQVIAALEKFMEIDSPEEHEDLIRKINHDLSSAVAWVDAILYRINTKRF